jgi:hypothetical protein
MLAPPAAGVRLVHAALTELSKSDSKYEFAGVSQIGPFTWHPAGYAVGTIEPSIVS